MTEMSTGDALEMLGRYMATDSRDWGASSGDALLWAVLLGWGCEKEHEHDDDECLTGVFEEIAAHHQWSPERVESVRQMRRAVLRSMGAPEPAADWADLEDDEDTPTNTLRDVLDWAIGSRRHAAYRLRRLWHRARYVDYANETRRVLPPVEVAPGEDDATARIQAALDIISGTDTPEYRQYLDARRAWRAKWYRLFVRRPYWVQGGVVCLPTGTFAISKPIILAAGVTFGGDGWHLGVNIQPDSDES